MKPSVKMYWKTFRTLGAACFSSIKYLNVWRESNKSSQLSWKIQNAILFVIHLRRRVTQFVWKSPTTSQFVKWFMPSDLSGGTNLPPPFYQKLSPAAHLSKPSGETSQLFYLHLVPLDVCKLGGWLTSNESHFDVLWQAK